MAVQHVGEGAQRDAGGERPTRAVPLAIVAVLHEGEFRVAALCRGGAVGSVEALRVHQLFPRHLETLPGLRQVEIPGRVANLLTHVGMRAVLANRPEELVFGIPATLFVQLTETW